MRNCISTQLVLSDLPSLTSLDSLGNLSEHVVTKAFGMYGLAQRLSEHAFDRM